MEKSQFEIRVDDNLSLRFSYLKDAKEIFKLVDKNRLEFRKWLPWVDHTISSNDTEKYLLECVEKFENKTGADFSIWYNNQIVGSVGFNLIDHINEKAEIGYWLDSELRGNGLMTKCVKAAVDYGFNDLNLHRIEISCSVKNIKSLAIPERLGFTLEGTFRESSKRNGEFSDSLLFGILKREWHQ